MSAIGQTVAEPMLKSKLTLSAAGETEPQPDKVPSAPTPIRIPARRRRRDRQLPVAAALEDERDPLTPGLLAELDHYTESELRALWGDR